MIHIFDKYKINNRFYGGSEKKIGIDFNGYSYMLKFQKKTQFGLRFNHISEYIGSHIYEMLGIESQETVLGTYRGECVVACKDFIQNGYQFVPFNDVGESSIEEDRDAYQYSYEDIIKVLKLNKKITNIDKTISIFFDMYIIDALLGNFDRHGGNWGFLKKDNNYKLAPIFDNGSCLFPQLIDENEMVYIMNDMAETNQRVYKFPTSQIKLGDKKSSYFEIISSLCYQECNEALNRITPLIDIQRINSLIDDIEIISEVHKSFYKYMIKERYEKILLYSYKQLEKKNLK